MLVVTARNKLWATTDLFQPLLAEVVRLALDAESRNSKHQVTLVKSGGPLQDRIDDALVGAGDVAEDGGDVGSVDVDGVDVGEAVGQLVNQWKVRELSSQIVKRSVGRHGQGWWRWLSCKVQGAMAGLEAGDATRGNGNDEARRRGSNRCCTK